MSDARLASETRSGEQRELRSLGQQPTYFQWENGRVARVFLSDDDSTVTANIKKGVIDMFQLRVNDEQHSEVTSLRFCYFYDILNENDFQKYFTITYLTVMPMSSF